MRYQTLPRRPENEAHQRHGQRIQWSKENTDNKNSKSQVSQQNLNNLEQISILIILKTRFVFLVRRLGTIILSRFIKKKPERPLFSSDDEGEGDEIFETRNWKTYEPRRNTKNNNAEYLRHAVVGSWRNDENLRLAGGIGNRSGDRMTKLAGHVNVAKIAIISRLLVLCIQIFTNNVLSNIRHESDGFKFIPEKGYGNKLDEFVNKTLGGFANWDGQYFLHISVYGYTQENMLAFFPLFPTILFLLSKCLHFISFGIISMSSLVLLTGWILNTGMFIKSADIFYELVINSGLVADPTPTVILFCFNAASIFYSALYTESLFMFLTLNVIVNLYKGKPYVSLIWASLSSLCRSNGLLNFGFIGAFFLQHALIKHQKSWGRIIVDMFCKGIICVWFLLPFLAFQLYGIMTFCSPHTKTSPLPPYCEYKTLPYSYVQEHYWNQGLFRYFQIKQLPNFMLAFPVLYFLFIESWKKCTMLIKNTFTYSNASNVYNLYVALHGIVLSLFCFTCIHVQVSTRLILSAFPYLFIFIASACQNEIVAFRQRIIQWPLMTSLVQIWTICYFLFGSIAFSLGLPWT